MAEGVSAAVLLLAALMILVACGYLVRRLTRRRVRRPDPPTVE